MPVLEGTAIPLFRSDIFAVGRNARLSSLPMFAGDRDLGARVLIWENDDAPNLHRGCHRPSRRHGRDLECHRYTGERPKTGQRGSGVDSSRRDADDAEREEPSRSTVRRALTAPL